MLLTVAMLPLRWATDQKLDDVRRGCPSVRRLAAAAAVYAQRARSAAEDGLGGRAGVRAWMDRSMESLVLLWVLYFVQGLPFGFQSKSLPLLLRERGFTLRHIGYANLLSVPWTCKFLIAPFVDRWGASSRWGRRKAWIFPMQFCLVVACLAAAYNYVRPRCLRRAIPHLTAADFLHVLLSALQDTLEFLMPIILMMNICTATMDVAVDGLALDVLNGENELGWGKCVINLAITSILRTPTAPSPRTCYSLTALSMAVDWPSDILSVLLCCSVAQTVGYKMGMIIGGGVLLQFAEWSGMSWPGFFVCMAGICVRSPSSSLACPQPA